MSEKLIKSQYLQQFSNKLKDKFFVYHTLFGNPKIFNKKAIQFLDFFKYGNTLNEAQQITNGDLTSLITIFTENNFLVPIDFDERKILLQKKMEHLKKVKEKQTINHISLAVSNICNLGCEHCMFFQDISHHQNTSSVKMNWKMAKKCLDAYIKIMTEINESHGRIHFGNAEPLLNWSVIEKTVAYCQSQNSFDFEYGMNTNLWQLNKKMAEFLKKYKIRIATSLDGLEIANDTIRVTKNNKGTFIKLIKKIDLLEQIGYPLDSISITVTSKNFHLINKGIIDFAAKRKMSSVAFDYDLINLVDIPINKRVAKIMELKNYAEDKNIFFGGTWGAPFRKLMSISLLKQPHAFCSAKEGNGLTFNPDGNLKSCDYSNTGIGNIDQLDETFKESGGLYQFVNTHFPGFDKNCQGCIIESQCGGQCYVTQEVAKKTSKKLTEDMCHFYTAMTKTLIKKNLNNF